MILKCRQEETQTVHDQQLRTLVGYFSIDTSSSCLRQSNGAIFAVLVKDLHGTFQ